MQYSIPQFIEIEDKVIGSLTVKQFLYLVAGGVFLLIVWQFADLELFILLAILTSAVVVPFAFIKVNGRPFQVYLLAMFRFTTRPKLLFWVKTKETPHINFSDINKRISKTKESQLSQISEKEFPRSKIRELSHVLNTQ
ncbi:MAG: PrgI family protein [Patescibacteria group bacterium]